MNNEEKYEIFTDASFDNKTKFSTYGIVITKKKKIIKSFGKKCRLTLKSSMECEVFAIFQAINIIEGSLIKKEKSQKFWLQTDCQGARDFFVNEQNTLKLFNNNLELYNQIKDTYKRVSNKIMERNSIFELMWIPRKSNKIAHKCTYSVFKNLRPRCLAVEKERIVKVLKEFDSRQNKTLIYLCLIANEDKMIRKTQIEISKALEIPLSSINKIFKELRELKVLKKINNGEYKLMM